MGITAWFWDRPAGSQPKSHPTGQHWAAKLLSPGMWDGVSFPGILPSAHTSAAPAAPPPSPMGLEAEPGSC